jgi:ribose-phosphate pyrophosphokinase
MSYQLLGFEDERQLVTTFAKKLGVPAIFALEMQYRAGELTVRMPEISAKEVVLVANIHEEPRYALRTLFVAKALRHTGVRRCTLIAPWIAYGRQDRVPRPGEVPGGLVIGDMLSRLFDKIITLDAHSPIFVSAFHRKLTNVWAAPDAAFRKQLGPVDVVIAADHGASRRAKACAKHLGIPCVILEKKRNAEGVQTTLLAKDMKRIVGKQLLIVDDISDTGGTLVSASAMLREHGAESVKALVSHVPSLSVLRERVGGVIKVEAFHDHVTQTVQGCAIDALIHHI